jgi:hypothetical protein
MKDTILKKFLKEGFTKKEAKVIYEELKKIREK